MEFSIETISTLLQEVPPKPLDIPRAARSRYIQTEVFDVLKRGEIIDLSRMDWDAFELAHVTPEDYIPLYLKTEQGWLKGLNMRIQTVAPVQPKEQKYF